MNNFIRKSYHKITQYIIYRRWISLLALAISFIIFIFSIVKLIFLIKNSAYSSPDLSLFTEYVLLALISIIAISFIVTRRFFKKWYKFRQVTGSRLQNRIIIIFGMVAAIPTLIVAIFSTIFFNYGLQAWFDKKIMQVLDTSVNVGELYIKEHHQKIKDNAFTMAEDINKIYFDLANDSHLFQQILNAQTELRALDEAFIFNRVTGSIVAQTSLSFGLAFSSIPQRYIDRADNNEIVEINNDPYKLRMLIKLKHSNNYLVIGKLIEKDIINYIDKSSGAAANYKKLKRQRFILQIKYSLAFLGVTFLIMLLSMTMGYFFANYLVMPIRKLVKATDRVKKGDFSIILEEGHQDDEFAILASAFNRMTSQLEHQRRDLAIAQRSAAWADVAKRVAHEIKNPLTPIQLASDRLQKKFSNEVSDQEQYNKYLSTIKRHAADIKKIVEEFTDFARLPKPKFKKTDIEKLLAELIDARQAINENIEYNYQALISNYIIEIDPDQFHRVVVNLLKNSEEALSRKSDIKPEINISIYQNDSYQLVIEFKDNGPGFPEELIDKITEPYVSSNSKGMGLGLSIVKKILEDHNAYLEIDNVSKKGGALIKLIFND